MTAGDEVILDRGLVANLNHRHPGGQPEGHVGVLGVGEQKVAAGRIGQDPTELRVERFFHGGSHDLVRGYRKPTSRRKSSESGEAL